MKLDEAMMRDFSSEARAKPSSNVFMLGGVSEAVLSRHRKSYAGSIEGQPLFAVNAKSLYFGFPFTGLLITDKGFAFKTVKDSIFSSLLPRKGGVATLRQTDIKSFQIGRHDRCLGTSYVGHQLIVNGEVVGLVRMGSNILLDENAIDVINSLALFLFERGEINEAPKPFKWQ